MRSNGAAIRIIRERTELSQAQLAEMARMDRTLIARIELSERNGTPRQIKAIAAALDCPLNAILAWPEEAVA